MTALRPTTIVGEVVWLGIVTDRKTTIKATETQSLDLTFAGQEGESHAGLTRPSCMRVLSQHPLNTEIRNARQLSIVSEEELQLIAEGMGMESIDPTLFGASMVVRGIPDFTHLPPSARLQYESGTTLTVDMVNTPCSITRKAIQAEHEGYGDNFKIAAYGRRGVTAWVEREGPIAVGDSVTVHVPDQRAWACLRSLEGFDMNRDVIKDLKNDSTLSGGMFMTAFMMIMCVCCAIVGFVLVP